MSCRAAARPILDAASVLGGTPGWLLLISLAFWWSGSRLGVRVALVASISAVSNLLLKWALMQPRPYFLSDRITPLEASDGFGMPSGHAQGSAATWGAVAYWTRARWMSAVGALAVLLAGLARVYYGVHSVAAGGGWMGCWAPRWSPPSRACGHASRIDGGRQGAPRVVRWWRCRRCSL